MAIHLPPVIKTSKRTIPGTRIFDASKVFADYTINSNSTREAYSSHYKSTFNELSMKNDTKQTRSAGKVNHPDPTNVHFLFENPRFINEPVCHASTKATKPTQHVWWPTEIPTEVKLTPSYSLNSTSRSDFGRIETRPVGLTRFSCVEGKRMAANGIIPVTELPTRHIKTEKISYNHQFDSRRERRERGKLHGSFVWDTSGKSTLQKTRRFAKKHFECSDSIDMTEAATKAEKVAIYYRQSDALMKYNPHKQVPVSDENNRSRIVAETINEDRASLKQSKLVVPASDMTLKSQSQKGVAEPHINNDMSASKKERQRGDKKSPPPHLC